MSVELQLHPYCALFPQASDSEIVAMADSILRNGLREWIVRHLGLIIDGRNRFLACTLANVEPKFVDYDGDTSDSSLLEFVLSKNAGRRHMSTSQRALIAAKMSAKPNDENENTPIGGFTQGRAAEIMAVSLREVQRAAQLIREGTPELIAEVERGEKTVHAALEEYKLSEMEPAVDNCHSVDQTDSAESTDSESGDQVEICTFVSDEESACASVVEAQNGGTLAGALTAEPSTSTLSSSDRSNFTDEESNVPVNVPEEQGEIDEDAVAEHEKYNTDEKPGSEPKLDASDGGVFKWHIDMLWYEVDKINKVPSRFLTLTHETIALEGRGEGETKILEDVLDAAAEEIRLHLERIATLKSMLRPSNGNDDNVEPKHATDDSAAEDGAVGDNDSDGTSPGNNDTPQSDDTVLGVAGSDNENLESNVDLEASPSDLAKNIREILANEQNKRVVSFEDDILPFCDGDRVAAMNFVRDYGFEVTDGQLLIANSNSVGSSA